MRLPTPTLRQAIRLLEDPRISYREIGRIWRISPNTAKAVRKLLERKSLTWTLLCELDDEQLEQKLFAGERGLNRKPVLNWLIVHEELRKDDMAYHTLNIPPITETGINPER